ncbi:hypothetical protein [Aquibacillus saliphilus]|uniref:hypothetical protein n=1 Tax=Aquibacillus saliphilus TaxID=1909422 RepID=UPI001CF0A040|nr:hypothetical protein [Aquibacillus saliphilus]
MVTSHLRGHPIEILHGEWVFSDTKEPTALTHKDRDCGHCNLPATVEGHDGCLGTLKGVMNCCCGHGDVKETYVQFLDGSGIYGEDAVTILDILKRYKDDD